MTSAKKWGTITLATLGVGTTATLLLLAKRREAKLLNGPGYFKRTKINFEECDAWCKKPPRPGDWRAPYVKVGCNLARVRRRRDLGHGRDYECACGDCR